MLPRDSSHYQKRTQDKPGKRLCILSMKLLSLQKSKLESHSSNSEATTGNMTKITTRFLPWAEIDQKAKLN